MNVRLGIDLGGTFIKAGIIDTDSKILAKIKYPSAANDGPDAVIRNLNIVYQKLLDICNQNSYQPLSLGIGSPGTIHQPDGKVTDATPNIPGWLGTVLTQIFDGCEIPIFADNDANCVALAEYKVSYQAQYKDMLFITIGTGIGGGIIIDGKLHRGSNFTAAEIGHTIIRHNGRLCKCGRKGCLEAYASVPNMMKRAHHWAVHYRQKLPEKITPEELYERFKKGNKIAKMTIIENAEYLGAGIGSFLNILNPEIVVIGGGFSGTGSKYLKLIETTTKKYAFGEAFRKLVFARAKMGNDAGFVGAALLGIVDEKNQIG
jgi:glucokinase